MQLIKLTSNMESFHTVNFKPNELNIILGTESQKDKKDLEKTFNGVWKSLLLNIVNFCLWSNKYKAFEEKLDWWEFSLEFKIWETEYISTRNTSKQNEIILNWKALILKEFNKILEKELFDIPKDTDYLSFRALIKRFLRVEKDSSRKWDWFKSEKAYQTQLYTWFLLGLDVSLMQEKLRLKNKIDEYSSWSKLLEKDVLFKKFFLWMDDVNIHITEYEEKVKKLENDLSRFKIADNYYEIETEVNNLKNYRNQISNNLFLLKSQLESIEDSLKIKINLSLNDVIKTYKEAKIYFDDKVTKKLEEVEAFHLNLIETRSTRLYASKHNLLKEISKLEEKLESAWSELDKRVKYLWEHWALDEYDWITKKLSDEKSTLDRLQFYLKTINEYKRNIEKLKTEFAKQNELTLDYLEDNKDFIRSNSNLFRDFAKRFYPNSSPWISVIENLSDNTIRFDIGVKIDYDASDWIWEIKIFCFDLTLLLLHRNHTIDFIFHDSRILSDVDSRQITTLFILINELLLKHKFQYIISINQNTLNSVKDINPDLYDKLMINNVILELTDESEKTKLLWINVEMDYEK